MNHCRCAAVSELEREGQIRKTGKRKTKPETGCEGELYEVTERGVAILDCPDSAERFGYPGTIRLAEGSFERQPPLSPYDAPGVPYARADGPDYIRMCVRVMLPTCDGCGKALRMIEAEGRKTYRCGGRGCPEWELRLANEAGRAPLLSLVATKL
jgi:hypothetical protein